MQNGFKLAQSGTWEHIKKNKGRKRRELMSFFKIHLLCYSAASHSAALFISAAQHSG